MPGRGSANGYKYGFNGKENDGETVSTGEGMQDYGMRIYNPSLGRFLSVDPLTDKYPWYTPYQFAGNKPINYIDLDGAEEWPAPGGGTINGPFLDQAAAEQAVVTGKADITLEEIVVGVQRKPKAIMPLELMSPEQQKIISPNSSTSNGIIKISNYSPSEQFWQNEQKRLGYIGSNEQIAYTLFNQGYLSLQRWNVKNPGCYTNLDGTYAGASEAKNAAFNTFTSAFGAYVFGGLNGIATSASAELNSGKNIVGTSFDDIKPTQDWMNRAQVDKYKSMLRNGQPVDPIITYQNNRGIFIEDGHHRFAAYMELGLKPSMFMRSTGGPVGYLNWTNTTYSKIVPLDLLSR